MNEIVKNYFIFSNHEAFQGISGFLKNNPKYKKPGKVSKVFKSLSAYTLHRPVRYKYQRAKTLVYGHLHFIIFTFF
jgi:hypothetical protein